jgi:hypothetical protein
MLLAAGINRKYRVLSILDTKNLKTIHLCGLLHDARTERDNAGLRTAHDTQLQVSGFKLNNLQMALGERR